MLAGCGEKPPGGVLCVELFSGVPCREQRGRPCMQESGRLGKEASVCEERGSSCGLEKKQSNSKSWEGQINLEEEERK